MFLILLTCAHIHTTHKLKYLHKIIKYVQLILRRVLFVMLHFLNTYVNRKLKLQNTDQKYINTQSYDAKGIFLQPTSV